jgi:hypothetical protein
VPRPLAGVVVIGSLLLGPTLAGARQPPPAPGAASDRSAPPLDPAAVHIARDSVAASQVVALGRDLVLEGRAASGVAVIRGSARILGSVEGDVVVLGGDADLDSEARVGGDVFVLGGAIHARAGAEVRGRTVAYPTAPGTLLVLAEGPALGLSPWSRVVVGTKLALLAAWLITAMALVGFAWPALASTADAVAATPLRSFTTGLVAVLAAILAALFLSSFLGVAAGVPLLVLLALVVLVLKLWGTVAVCACLGTRLARRTGWPATAPLTATLCGLGLLGGVKFVPWVGVWAWTAATLIGVGASLLTKLGRREPWLTA